MKILAWALALTLSSATCAGDFSITHEDSSGVWVSYSGGVSDHDASMLNFLMVAAGNRNVFVTINSPGGSAYGGLALFWEAEQWSNLTTIAGKEQGAWSAAAVFWLGSPRDWFESEDSKVSFHQAYCLWWDPPGCDLTHFRARLCEAFAKAGYDGRAFDRWLTAVQAGYGVSGWAMLTDEGWHFHDSSLDITYRIHKPIWEY